MDKRDKDSHTILTIIYVTAIIVVLIALFGPLVAGCVSRCDNPRSMACMSAAEIEKELAQ